MSFKEYRYTPDIHTVPPLHPHAQHGQDLGRYVRAAEVPRQFTIDNQSIIPFTEAQPAIEASSLSQGSKDLLSGLLQIGSAKVFPGGGVGIEYGGVLKTMTRPDIIKEHIREAADHLREKEVELLYAPGMSGFPYAAMVSLESGISSVLLKKSKHDTDPSHFPPGSFIIPSYTGEGTVMIAPDMHGVQQAVDTILSTKLKEEPERTEIIISQAGADDIIDKATMSTALCEMTDVTTRAAVDHFFHRYFLQHPFDTRIFDVSINTVAFVTPLMKGYNKPHDELERKFGFKPFAGVTINSLHLEPPAIGIEGIGILEFNQYNQEGVNQDIFVASA